MDGTLPEVTVTAAPPQGASLGQTVGSLAANLIPGVGSLLGGLFANHSAAESAQKQMDFQERMSNTQYQRTMADMKKAGLNPMLAAFGGGLDNAPQGALYTPQNPVSPAVVSSISSSVGQLQRLGADIYSELSGAKRDRAQAAYAEVQRKYTSTLETGARSDNAQKAAMEAVFKAHPEALGYFKALFGNVGVGASTRF